MASNHATEQFKQVLLKTPEYRTSCLALSQDLSCPRVCEHIEFTLHRWLKVEGVIDLLGLSSNHLPKLLEVSVLSELLAADLARIEEVPPWIGSAGNVAKFFESHGGGC